METSEHAHASLNPKEKSIKLMGEEDMSSLSSKKRPEDGSESSSKFILKNSEDIEEEQY